MISMKSGGSRKIVFLGFPHFAAESFHAVLTRHGGVSSGPWSSLNVGFGGGDREENVRENRRRIKQALGITRLVSCRQVHGGSVRVIDRLPAGDLEIGDCDALVTDVPGLALMIQQADCQAVFLHDPVRRAVGIAHSGWRGSAANIIGATVEIMIGAYGTRPHEITAGISPSLGPCCAEFIHYRTEMPPLFHHYQVRPRFFDFWSISRDQLQAEGVRPDNIKIAGLCTSCCSEFFSYRREGITGRFASVIGLPER